MVLAFPSAKMMWTLRINPRLLPILLLVALLGVAFPAQADDLLYLEHGGRERSYTLFVPPEYKVGTPLPLVIALHGGGGNARINEQMTALAEQAARYNFILVQPNGTGRLKTKLLTWNAGNCCGYAHEKQVDDVGFIRTIIDTLVQHYSIDPKRVYATGLSNGAKMSYRLACQLSDKISAIAPVAGSMEEPDCRPLRPVSVMAFHGTADEHILYEGGAPKNNADRHPRVDNSVADSVGYWVRHNQCAPVPERSQKGAIVRDSYNRCAEGSDVVLYTILGGGHTWPGGTKLRRRADTPTQQISASNEMVKFFLSHPGK